MHQDGVVSARTGLVLSLLALAACQGRAERAPVAVVRPSPPPAGGWAAPGGRTFVVAQRHPYADDANPGTPDQPWRTISRATRRGTLRPGDAVVIGDGVYRESIQPVDGGRGPDARITFAAAPGARVVVTGADLAVAGWQRQGRAWRRAWHGPSMETYSADPVFRRELVVVQGRVLRPVARDALQAGTFWTEGPDTAPVALWMQLPEEAPPDGQIEVGHRPRLFWPVGPDPFAACGDPETPGWLRVVGITFRHASNRAQWGAVCAGSIGGLLEDVRVEWTNGQGIDVSGRAHRFRRVRADYNGQLGWGGSCQGCLIDESAAVGNNWKGHDPFWEAGGAKWTRTSQTRIRRFYAAHNDGPGIWLDIDNDRNTIEGSLAVRNQVAGIMVELRSTRTLVQHNVVAATRWREWSGTGMLSQAASQNAYLHNSVVANEGSGLWLRLDPDRRAPDGRNVVENNWIVGNAVGAPEARELSVEGSDTAHVRSSRFAGNTLGRLGGGMTRSTFYVHPAPQISRAGFRGQDVALWERLTGARGTRLISGDGRPAAVALGTVGAGAPGTAPIRADRVGADPSVVRARGAWQSVPPRAPWPR